MKATQRLHGLGQSLWLDNITRELLTSGALQRYIEEWSVTGLTSNLTIFEEEIRNGNAYDVTIREKLSQGKTAEKVFFELALEDVTRAADFFQAIHQRTNGVDGWVSVELSPLLAHDATKTLEAAKDLFARAKRSNLFIKIPGTKEGLAAIEEAIFAGIPVNVTLLFSRQQYVAAADAFLKGVERRIDAGLNPDVPSVASIFVSRWDVAANAQVPRDFRNKLGIAVATRSYRAYRSLLESPRWQRAYNFGARPQRLLWGSTGTKDPTAADTLYVTSLAAPFTVNTMPEATMKAYAEHGGIFPPISPQVELDREIDLIQFAASGVYVDELAEELQEQEANSFVQSWNDLMDEISSKRVELKKAS